LFQINLNIFFKGLVDFVNRLTVNWCQY
jgi:hypothetical protein